MKSAEDSAAAIMLLALQATDGQIESILRGLRLVRERH